MDIIRYIGMILFLLGHYTRRICPRKENGCKFEARLVVSLFMRILLIAAHSLRAAAGGFVGVKAPIRRFRHGSWHTV